MSTRTRAKARARVLIVDDDESMRLLLAKILSSALKVEATLAGTGEEALRLARKQRYDVILLDLLIPGTSGFKVLRTLRAGSRNVGTPVIIVSVLSETFTKEHCIAAGATAYIAKPVDRDVLVAAVKAQLEEGDPPAAGK
jgi:DNA-binding response OmpR family regulator